MTLPPPLPDEPPPYDHVVFDCDSTLSSLEGIDELARLAAPDREEELASLTRRAMDGELTLEEIYARRLELIRPTRKHLRELSQRYIATASPGARELIQTLLGLKKRVSVLTGGLTEPVQALAASLGIDPQRVYGVGIQFDSRGEFLDFDRSCPLTQSGGKPTVLRESVCAQGERVALVGDGITDLEAAACVHRFVAYGGVERRDVVFQAAIHGVETHHFAALAPFLLAPDELP